MLTTELKMQTKAAHLALENKMVPLIKAMACEEDYRSLLRMMYGYYRGLEDRIAPFFQPAALPGDEMKRKTDLILNDLEALEPGSTLSLPVCQRLPDIPAFHPALGARYVLEGAALGGQVIAGMVERKLERVGHALSFFRGYGEKTMERWLAFKQVLDQPFTAAQQQAVLDAANATFHSFKNWIIQHEYA